MTTGQEGIKGAWFGAAERTKPPMVQGSVRSFCIPEPAQVRVTPMVRADERNLLRD